MKYSIDWLKTQIENGLHPEYLLFWGHSQKMEGVTDKSCFSQWWPAPFTVDGTTYATAEHWMMAKKALLFDDKESFDLIITAKTPSAAKKLGRSVKNFNNEIWTSKAFEIVTEGNLHKFSQHEVLKQFLLQTGNRILAEASPVDYIWGIGLSQKSGDANNPFKWKGTNLLGFALMEVRDQLKK